MVCPLCRQRKARRACPALGNRICAVCCGTKRLVEIACPADCPYLTSSREHPPAAAVRRHQDDVSSIVRAMRDLNERQSRLLLLILSALVRYQPSELQPLVDEDVADAVGALAATSETAVRGVIYEHRPASLSAERLIAALKRVLAEVDPAAGTSFQRDAAVVLRRVETAAREAISAAAGNRRAFVDLLRRIIRPGEEPAGSEESSGEEPPRVIIP